MLHRIGEDIAGEDGDAWISVEVERLAGWLDRLVAFDAYCAMRPMAE